MRIARWVLPLAALLLGFPLAAFAQTGAAAPSNAASALTAAQDAEPPAPDSSGEGTDGYWSSWLQRSDRAKAEQPHWMPPLVTTTPLLTQAFRYDVAWQQAHPDAPYTENLGSGKGLELIPFDGVEVIFSVPPYLIHHSPTVDDGFGDFQMLVKYRMAAADDTHGAYVLTAFVGVSFPTGTAANGQADAVVTPAIAYGKASGPFDIQGTFGIGLPVANEASLGRTYAWNNTFQYHVAGLFWPELELNTTWFQDGPHSGQEQTYVTPALCAHVALTRRLSLSVGAGVQIATSRFHLSDHNPIVSARLLF